MRPQQQTPEPLRFRYRAKLGPWLLALGGALTFTALLVHAARSGMGVPNRGFAGYFAFDPALFWWSAAVIVFAAGLFCLRGVINALGPGKTITLTEENLIFSGKSATDRERIPYRNIAHARCVDLSTTEATIVIRFGRAEKQLASPLFESLPDFYAFWSALRTRLNPAVVQGTDPEGFEQHGSTRRAVESLISRKYWVIGSCIAAAVVVVVYVVRHGPAATEPSPVAAATVLASGPRPMFVAEQITSAAQQAEFEQLHLVLPLRLPLEHLHWVVDRQQQIYFVGEGAAAARSPICSHSCCREKASPSKSRPSWRRAVWSSRVASNWIGTSPRSKSRKSMLRRLRAASRWCGRHWRPTAFTAMPRSSRKSG
jgi:hypothetical protein